MTKKKETHPERNKSEREERCEAKRRSRAATAAATTSDRRSRRYSYALVRIYLCGYRGEDDLKDNFRQEIFATQRNLYRNTFIEVKK